MGHDESRIWARLRKGEGLQDLGLPANGGRVDLRGLAAPQPSVEKRIRASYGDVKQLGGIVQVRGATWSHLDLSRGLLDNLRFLESRIEDCLFEKARCRHWSIWETSVSDTSFRSADLRDALLGGRDGGKQSVFRGVDFSGADLRATIHGGGAFMGCSFRNARLSGIDFQGSTFEDCVFEGVLDDVLFYRTGFEGEGFPPNEMRNVDFSKAKLRFVGFRGLDLSYVRLPEEDVAIEDARATLERTIRAYESRTDTTSRQVAGFLRHELRWAPRQGRSVLSRFDFVDTWGEQAWEDLVRVVRS